MKIAFISSSVTLVTMQKLALALSNCAIALSVSTVVSVETENRSRPTSGAIATLSPPPQLLPVIQQWFAPGATVWE